MLVRSKRETIANYILLSKGINKFVCLNFVFVKVVVENEAQESNFPLSY